MSKLDEIEERVKLFGPDDMLRSDVLFVLKVARKAEEMAKWLSDDMNTEIETGHDQFMNNYKVNDKAKEFLSFLEKGE